MLIRFIRGNKAKIILLMVLLAFALTLNGCKGSGGWALPGAESVEGVQRGPWYAEWLRRQAITISSAVTASDLIDFPVLIKITDQDNPVFDNARPDGDDIYFTLADGVTRLDHEIEFFQNTSAKELDAWVRIPELSSSVDTVIYMYYGDSGLPSQANPAGVWDSDYAIVQHLQESPANGTAGGHYDSTSNNNDCTPDNFTGFIRRDADGMVDGANEWIANGEVVDCGNDGSLDLTGDFTISMWFNADSWPGITALASKMDEFATSDWYLLYWAAPAEVQFYYGNNLSQELFVGQGINPGTGSWHQIVLTRTGNDFTIYLDGGPQATETDSAAVPTGDTLYIGGMFSFDGRIDEVRLSQTARSEEWIAASWNNINNPAGFLSFGAEEPVEQLPAEWPFRQRVTISNAITPSDQTDFPVLVQITDQMNPVFDNAQAGGSDILFTTADMVTKIPHEIEYYRNTATREIDAWVRLPLLSVAQDTVIYMYYGNAGALDQQNAEAVWDDNFTNIQHLNETSGMHLDSTSKDNDSVSVNVTTQGGTAAAKIGGADEFDGVDDVVGWNVWFTRILPCCPNRLLSAQGDPGTVEAWFRPSGAAQSGVNIWNVPLVAGDADGDLAILRGIYGGQDRIWVYNYDSSLFVPDMIGIPYTADQWMHIVWVHENGDLHAYINGQEYAGSPVSSGNTWANQMRLGMNDYGPSVEGFIDEVRTSNVARGADWILASYNNQNNPAGFLTFGAEEVN